MMNDTQNTNNSLNNSSARWDNVFCLTSKEDPRVKIVFKYLNGEIIKAYCCEGPEFKWQKMSLATELGDGRDETPTVTYRKLWERLVHQNTWKRDRDSEFALKTGMSNMSLKDIP